LPTASMLHANSRFLTARTERFGMTKNHREILLDEIALQENIHLFFGRRQPLR
jgi:hypothetical protein